MLLHQDWVAASLTSSDTTTLQMMSLQYVQSDQWVSLQLWPVRDTEEAFHMRHRCIGPCNRELEGRIIDSEFGRSSFGDNCPEADESKNIF